MTALLNGYLVWYQSLTCSSVSSSENRPLCPQDVEFTLGDESDKSRKNEMSSAELTKQMDRLIQDKANNQRIFDWVEVCIFISFTCTDDLRMSFVDLKVH